MKYFMNTQPKKLEDFVMVSRKIKDDYLDGKLTKNEFDVLLWIFLCSNPFNGYYTMSYEGLTQEFRGGISKVNARKIISSLRKEQYIYFTNHKGRAGSFPVYPVNFRLTSGATQTLEYLKNKELITTQPVAQVQTDNIPHHNLGAPNHNPLDIRKNIIKGFPEKEITTSYNDNKNNNNKYNIGDINIFENKSSSFPHKEKNIIPVDSFFPKTYEQEQCWKIAKELGETDMRFMLSCLHKYKIHHVEKAWSIFKKIQKNKIADPGKYFNKLIRNLAEAR
jgi:hypothetical protein